MPDPSEKPINDLFDFPEVGGLEDFGLVPPVPSGPRAEKAADAAAKPVAAPTAPDASAAPDAESAEADRATETESQAPPVEVAAARPNPPVPEGVDDLDEDLFQFDELFSIENDPYHNGTLGADGQPFDTGFDDPVPVAQPHAPAPTPAPAPVQQAAPTPVAAPAPPAPQAAPAPAPQMAPAAPAPAPMAQAPQPAAPLPAPHPAGAGDSGEAADRGFALRDRGPRILLPEDVPYSNAGESQRMLWVLIACFLFLCTGMFYITFQSSKAFQSTLLSTTERLATALDRSQAGAPMQPAPQPTSASVPVEPSMTYSIDLPNSEQRAAQLPKHSQADRWIDPRDYANTHEFAVGNAKAMLANGQFEEARRLLNHVLANQARIPLSPVLREEIDYLIPLTYFEQGNATAPTEGEGR